VRLKGWPILAVAAALLLGYAVEVDDAPAGDRTASWVLVVAFLILLGAWLATELIFHDGRRPAPEDDEAGDDDADADA
jgi:hypothetical protein